LLPNTFSNRRNVKLIEQHKTHGCYCKKTQHTRQMTLLLMRCQQYMVPNKPSHSARNYTCTLFTHTYIQLAAASNIRTMNDHSGIHSQLYKHHEHCWLRSWNPVTYEIPNWCFPSGTLHLCNESLEQMMIKNRVTSRSEQLTHFKSNQQEQQKQAIC